MHDNKARLCIDEGSVKDDDVIDICSLATFNVNQ